MDRARATPFPPHPTRRGLLAGLGGTALTLVAGCGAVGGLGSDASGPGNAAILLPLSGESGDLGETLRAAAGLGGGPGIGISLIDSGSTPETAAAAARQALDQGANMLLGPVFAAQVEALRDVVPSRVPVLTLSNNADLAGGGVWVFGVTPAQSVQAVFSLAAQRGLGRIAVVAPPGPLGAQSVAAATAAARDLGIELQAPVVRSSADGLLDALSAGGALPDAVYLPAADATLRPFAEALAGRGIQLMGSTQWAALPLTGIPAFRDAWFAAPDPLRFAAFDEAFQAATGQPAGIIAGLTYDGVELMRTLGRLGQQSPRGLTRKEGFPGVVGPCRFFSSGTCQRALSVLGIDDASVNLIASNSI